MKRKLFAISLAAMLLLGAGCGAKSTNSASPSVGQPAGSAGPSGGTENGYWDMNGGSADFSPEEPSTPSESESQSSAIYQNPEAKLIRRAELTIQTERFDESLEALNRLTVQCGGYFENASVYGGSRRDVNASRWGEYIVRVPAEKYDLFLSGAGNLGYVTSKNESSQDVGERYYDTEARLKTQRTKQDRLLALLERAETMEDIIVLENALSDVEYQIEQYSSELNRYDALVDFATFAVSLNEVGRITEEVGETASLGARMAAGIQTSVQNLGEGLQNFLIWVSYNLFLVVILAAIAVAAVMLGKREWKRLRRRDKTDSKTEE